MIEDIVDARDSNDGNHRLPFVTAEEMLKQAKESIQQKEEGSSNQSPERVQ